MKVGVPNLFPLKGLSEQTGHPTEPALDNYWQINNLSLLCLGRLQGYQMCICV